ncbi:MAG TPA: NADPH-dependent glutamate synthase [Clostridiaceae bacterium]|nr:NADPH-dependent glutamate synthase [Clostridiaceae bacterium]
MAKYKTNMAPEKTPMPEQEPLVRNKNYSEVTLGYTVEMAMEEATRCLQCRHRPCVGGCPVNIAIPDFINHIVEGDFEGAYQTILLTNSLPAVCGRVCPQENQCELVCVRGIKGEPVGIGRLERFAADWHFSNVDELPEKPESNGRRVAIVGSGPSGLACAGDLARRGYEVTVYESLHVAGGVLMYGIPEFRLPKSLVQTEIDQLRALGVKIECDRVIGRIHSLDELFEEEGFEAVFIGSGAGLPSFMGIPGENLNQVYSANEFLTRVNLMQAWRWPDSATPVTIGKKVAVVGGGNVAMDAARSAKRLGADEVYIVYRRSEEELPARKEEVEHAREEGIIFRLLSNPLEITGNEEGWVTGMRCSRMELGEEDASGRRRPVPIPDSDFSLDLDTVIVAIGQSPNPLLRETTSDLKCQSWGGIIVDEETLKTSKDGVWAGGDAVTGAATVILAMGAGKKAAASIDAYLKGK